MRKCRKIFGQIFLMSVHFFTGIFLVYLYDRSKKKTIWEKQL